MRNIYRKLNHEVNNGFVGDTQNSKALGAHDKSMAKIDPAKKQTDENAKVQLDEDTQPLGDED